MLRIRQYLEKVLNSSSTKDDILSVFKALDDGAHIDIAQVTDSYVQLKLYNIFKLMRLKEVAASA